MRGQRVVRIATIHAISLDPHIFILQRRGKGRWGWGMRVTRYAYRYTLILPAKQVFPFFGVKASFGDDSSLRRFTSGRGKCLVEPPA